MITKRASYMQETDEVGQRKETCDSLEEEVQSHVLVFTSIGTSWRQVCGSPARRWRRRFCVCEASQSRGNRGGNRCVCICMPCMILGRG